MHQSNSGIYDSEEEAIECLDAMANTLRESCFGASRVWVQKIWYGPKNIEKWTHAFTY